MKNLFTYLMIFAISIILTLDILAIPSFARKYNMTCKTCHSPFPRLKAYGEEFAGDGFVLKDQTAPRYFLETGDEELSLIRDVPLALRLEGYVVHSVKEKKSDFSSPFIFKVLSGGSLSKDVAYYFYYILENGETGKLEDAWFMLNNVFNSELDITFGQFQISDPLFKRELRLTRDDYLIYKTKPGNSKVNLAYDRGVMFSYTLPTNTDLFFQIVNGNGIGEGTNDIFDNDKYKNLFGRVSQEISESFRIGGFGYYGKEEDVFINDLWMGGLDLTFSTEKFEVNAQFVQRNDNNPLFNAIKKEVKTQGAFIELILTPNGDDSKWYAVSLFNWIESDLNYLNTKQLAFNVGYLLRRNIRFMGEYSFNFNRKSGQFSLGFVTAF
jgi:hypothetical protein